MKVIEIKCPNCNASLQVNSELETATCNYCGNQLLLEDENATKEERIIKAIGKQNDKDRKYYASDDYAKKLEVEAEANDKTIIGSIGRQLKQSREYYSSDSYKKALEIRQEQAKKTLFVLAIIFGVLTVFTILPLIMILLISILSPKPTSIDMNCTIKDKSYVVVIKKDKILCASCSDKMLDELNSKYLDNDSIDITEKNVTSYFSNNGGMCE